jgi:hypothetical protein
MIDTARAVVGYPVLVGARPHRHVEECHHAVDGIVETTCRLQPGTAAEVDEPAGHRGGPAPATGAFDDEDVGTDGGGLDRCGGTRDAVSRDHDIGFEVPVLDLVGWLGVDVGVHRLRPHRRGKIAHPLVTPVTVSGDFFCGVIRFVDAHAVGAELDVPVAGRAHVERHHLVVGVAT